MLKTSKINNVDRIIDANINRVKEGLRVCEEITRFILNDRKLTADFKNVRHAIDGLTKRLPQEISLLNKRDSLFDVGRNIYANELKRKNCKDIFLANLQRSKESVRVLEEFSKLYSAKVALGFKRIRYALYEIEKRTVSKVSSLRDLR